MRVLYCATMVKADALDRMLKALAHPARRRIFDLVTAEPVSVTTIGAKVGVSQPAASQFLATLLRTGLVERKKIGSRTFYHTRPDAIAKLSIWIACHEEGVIIQDKANAGVLTEQWGSAQGSVFARAWRRPPSR